MRDGAQKSQLHGLDPVLVLAVAQHSLTMKVFTAAVAALPKRPRYLLTPAERVDIVTMLIEKMAAGPLEHGTISQIACKAQCS